MQPVFSLFIGPPTSERAFQTGGALAGIISLLGALHGIETHFSPLHTDSSAPASL